MRIVLAAFLVMASVAFAHAADFIDGPGLPERCRVLMSGKIDVGDAEKFAAYQDSVQSSGDWSRNSLCLDSPGGSLGDALRIIDLWDGPTRIPENAECASSCALIFMAGSRHQSAIGGSLVDRSMHVTARLGFHAPDLIIPAQQYTEVAVKSAYALSLATIAEIMRRNTSLQMAHSLLVEMLDTPPDQMLYVDTIDKTTRWGIEIFGVAQQTDLQPFMAMNACLNASTEAYYTQDRGAYLTLSPFNVGNSITFDRSDGAIRATVGFGVGDGGMWECRFDYRPDTNAVDDLLGRDIWGEAVSGRITPALFHAPGTPLAEIARGQQPRSYAQKDSYQTTCMVLKDNTMLDTQTCLADVQFRLGDDLMSEVTQVFTWPSGARTVITSLDGTYIQARINGAATGYAAPDSVSPEARCLKNESSGNTFCYMPPEFGAFR